MLKFMTLQVLGKAALDCSTVIYLIWFIPQLRLTQQRHTTEGLSPWMHYVLLLGYVADLAYGFGRLLPMQYRLVTFVGLVSLSIQHWQFYRYGLKSRYDRRLFHGFNIMLVILSVYIVINLRWIHHGKWYYDSFGFVSMMCWMLFLWPQIIKNYYSKTTQGLSKGFVWLSIATGVCDVIAAYSLGWDLPSKMSAPLGVLKKSLLAYQCHRYDVGTTDASEVLA